MLRYNTQKRGILLFISIIFLALTLNSCATLGEWRYFLPNDYYIARTSTDTVYIMSPIPIKNGPFSTTTFVSNNYVRNFSYNNKYVAVQIVEFPIDYNPEYINYYIETSTPTYILIDTESHTIYRELDRQKYEDLLLTLDISDMCEWITTSVRPKGAIR